MKPTYLFKVISNENWQKSQEIGRLALTEMDQEFVHLAMDDQIERVLSKFWAGQSPLILKLDPTHFVGNLVLERNPGGTQEYFHLYKGFIPLDAVVEVLKDHHASKN